MKKLFTLLIFVSTSIIGLAQTSENPVVWKMTIENTEEEGVKNINLKAKVDNNWQLYSNDFDPNLGPMVTEFRYIIHSSFDLVGGTIPNGSKRKYDELWGGDYAYFEKEAEFNQKIKTTTETPSVEVQIVYQVCNTVDGKCIPFEIILSTDY